ncbi:hypothetical protein LXA43DRAFT_893585 [Ganoderma leucocontextum]|nr:hypothetical protein LXA43DRAFT_893585 [Ganoderma leucocontextum]
MATSFQAALRKLLPSPARLPPTLSPFPATLYQVLSRYPKDGVGQRVHQTRWNSKGFDECYWEITRTKLKCEGKHGQAWGHLVWKGKRVNEHDERIRGGLKYKWAVGQSKPYAEFKSPSTSPKPSS